MHRFSLITFGLLVEVQLEQEVQDIFHQRYKYIMKYLSKTPTILKRTTINYIILPQNFIHFSHRSLCDVNLFVVGVTLCGSSKIRRQDKTRCKYLTKLNGLKWYVYHILFLCTNQHSAMNSNYNSISFWCILCLPEEVNL